MVLFDSHCHLVFNPEDHPAQAQLERARAAGLGMMVCVAVDLESARACRTLAEKEPDVLASIGIHPNDCGPAESLPGRMDSLGELAREGGWAAVGETGMDFYRDSTPPRVQEDSFRAHLDLARTLELPVIIHCRHAGPAVLEILRDQKREIQGVMHCWSEGPDLVGDLLDLGLHFSFAGNLTYPKADSIRASSRLIPSSRLLIETDAPFLAPQPVRGQRNEPAHIRHTLETLASVREEDPSALEATTWAAADALFLPVPGGNQGSTKKDSTSPVE
jgi:TatD DNase family protein